MKSLEEEVAEDEGLRLKLYRDSVGLGSIGFGRNLIDVGISQDEANYLRANDCDRARTDAQKLPWFRFINDARQLVILSMLYQLGLPRFLQFSKTIAAIEAGDYMGASQEMMNSFWAKQCPNRAKKLSGYMATGTIPE